jgi:hypothetical protein
MTDKLKLEAPWPEVKEMLKEVNLELTDDDLEYDGENSTPLLDRLAKKMKRTPDKIKAWIESVSFNRGKAG